MPPPTLPSPTFIHPALGIFLVVLTTHIVQALYIWYITRADVNIKYQLEEQLKPLLRKMATLEGNVDFWVPLAKLQRQANVLQEKLNNVKTKLGETTPNTGAMGILDKVLKYANPKKWKEQAKKSSISTLCGLIIVYYWWGIPLFRFPENFFWPFGFVLSKPWLPSGSLGALGWFIVCTRAVPRIINSVTGVWKK